MASEFLPVEHECNGAPNDARLRAQHYMKTNWNTPNMQQEQTRFNEMSARWRIAFQNAQTQDDGTLLPSLRQFLSLVDTIFFGGKLKRRSFEMGHM